MKLVTLLRVSCSHVDRNLQTIPDYKMTLNKYLQTIVASYVMVSRCRLHIMLFSLYLFLCLHLDIISDRLFNKLLFTFSSIANFSLRQRLHRFVTGLYAAYCLTAFQLMLKFAFFSLILHTSFDSSVSVLYFSWFKAFL